MTKTTQPELLLQADLIGHRNDPKKGPTGLRGQGFYAEKQSERFKAGRPDLRLGHGDVGQLDVELKYLDVDIDNWNCGRELELGFTKLQWLKIKEMNEHGIPAVGLVFFAKKNYFLVTTERVLRRPLFHTPWVCSKLPAPQVIDGMNLFRTAKGVLSESGYNHRW